MKNFIFYKNKKLMKVSSTVLVFTLMFPISVFAADMSFFTSSITTLQTLVVALGAGLCAWGGINLLEGYGGDNPQAKSQGIKQLMAGGGVALIGLKIIPLLSGLLSAS